MELQNLSFIEVSISFCFSILLLATVMKELKLFDSLWKYCPLLLVFIPRWSFFAPVPNFLDFHLVYRCFLEDGTPLQWKEAYEMKSKRPFYSFLWNPEKRFLKGFLDILQDLIEFSNKIELKSHICTSLPYLHILNYVNSLNQDESVKHIQFMILSNSEIHDYEVFFRSELHLVTARGNV